MTKKTNSLILRYGISMLWKKKTSSVDVLSNILQLGKLINVWLKKNCLNLVDIKYGLDFIYIFVYKKFFLDERFKNNILNHYKKTLSNCSVIKKFGLQKNQLEFLLSELNLKKQKNLNSFLTKKQFYFILLLHYKRYLSLLFLMILRSYSLLGLNVYTFIIHQLIHFFINVYFFVDVKLNYYLSKTMRLKKINGFLKLKLISKGLENLIFKLKFSKLNIKLNNIYLTRGFFRFPFFGKQVLKPEFRFKFFTVFLSIAYLNSVLLSEYIVDFIKKGKQHRKNLQMFTNSFERIFFPRLLILSGFQLRVTGKLGGKLRKSKYHYKVGKVQLQTFNTVLSYSFMSSFTKFGVISIKVWLVK